MKVSFLIPAQSELDDQQALVEEKDRTEAVELFDNEKGSA